MVQFSQRSVAGAASSAGRNRNTASGKCGASHVPKLFLKAEPGGILAGDKVLEHARSLPAQTEVTVKGVHFVQEDSPDEIGQAVAGWMKTLG